MRFKPGQPVVLPDGRVGSVILAEKGRVVVNEPLERKVVESDPNSRVRAWTEEHEYQPGELKVYEEPS